MGNMLQIHLDDAAETVAKDFGDLDAYPILTEEVGYPPSPLSKSPGTPSTGTTTVPGGSPIGQIAFKAVADVLGWKPKAGDIKGFVGALTQSFTLTEDEGHVDATWTPRTYAVQTDLSGGITGAQASMYSRAKDALDQALPLLDGLYTLIPEADAEDVAALKGVARSQVTEMVNELALPGGPRVTRVNQYFTLLLGPATFPNNPQPNQAITTTDPDQVGGSLGQLRDTLGLSFTGQDFSNSVEDEQNLSNFRILSDYVTSLAQSWINNLGFFGLNSKTPFFGTQLVVLSRQLSVVSESVDEVRFTLDSVFIGPAERQTLQLNFHGQAGLYAEDLFNWIQNFATDEGPRLIQDGGKFGVQSTFLPIVVKLRDMVHGIIGKSHVTAGLPGGFFTARVQRSLRQLLDELRELGRMSQFIRHSITPEPNFGLPLAQLQVASLSPNAVFQSVLATSTPANPFMVAVLGQGFEFGPAVPQVFFSPYNSDPHKMVLSGTVYFRSQDTLAATVPNSLVRGVYPVTVINPDGTHFTLQGAFTVE